jgi:hypothetical protein
MQEVRPRAGYKEVRAAVISGQGSVCLWRIE